MTERDKLIEILKNDSCQSPMLCDPNCKYAKLERCYEERTADYLLENGVVIMPVDMIGKTLWFLDCDDNIICDKISGFVVSNKHNIYFFLQKTDDEPYELSEIGKDLFLTREEAENALKEQKK